MSSAIEPLGEMSSIQMPILYYYIILFWIEMLFNYSEASVNMHLWMYGAFLSIHHHTPVWSIRSINTVYMYM